MNSVVIVAILVLSALVSGSTATQKTYEVKLYEHEELQGLSLAVSLSGDQCFNVPEKWENEASSVDIGDTCVILFDGKNCAGSGVRLESQKVKGTQKLVDVYMNDQLSSLRLCSVEPAPPTAQ